jgi:hypothetical protein
MEIIGDFVVWFRDGREVDDPSGAADAVEGSAYEPAAL